MAGNSATTRHHNFQDMTGQRIGRLLVIEYAGRLDGKKTFWRCLCDCGATVICNRSTLRDKTTKSCGCLRDELASQRTTQHKLAYLSPYDGTGRKLKARPELKVWRSMFNRCFDPNDKQYHNYGGRGITVCDRWRHGDGENSSFDCFFLDMGSRPTPGHSLDRIDNNGNYEPINCRWATPIEQGSNTRKNRWIIVDGVSKTMSQWSRVYGVHPSVIFSRLRLGWSPQDAVSIPVKPKRKTKQANNGRS